MRKWYFVWVFGLIFLSFLALTQADEIMPATAVEALGEAMAATGATAERLIVNAWAQLPRADLADGELAAIAEQAMDRLGVKASEYELRHSRSERHRLVKAEAISDGSHAMVTVQVVHPVWGGANPAEAYLVVNVETTAELTTIAAWRGRVKAAAASGGGSPRINTCLVGWLDGKLEKDIWPLRLNKAREAISASVFDTLIQPGFASITGFSPVLPDCLTVGDKRINLNMAMRYSPNDNRTYVIVASPVIPGEY